jgi:glyoxylase-like metal-dependent hydrolase (beta-lactamase superfamily II)/ferredoxin
MRWSGSPPEHVEFGQHLGTVTERQGLYASPLAVSNRWCEKGGLESFVATLSKRLATNVAGDFYVDSTCIDCGTCRQVAPETFAPGRDASYVSRQPGAEDAVRRARMALVACPVAAIGTEKKHAIAEARAAFPDPIEAGVYYCGWAAESSYGARSYLIVRPGGNILVDSPRYAGPLLERIEALGGVRWMFLTHRDDVADHRKFRDRFGCERILHRADITAGTREVEIQLKGDDPVPLDDEALFIMVPGHTPGSTCLLYQGRFLFSGDHLWWDARRERLNASRSVCWYDWEAQTASMQRLEAYRFEWLLPGHGMRYRLPAETMREQVAQCIARMQRESGR